MKRRPEPKILFTNINAGSVQEMKINGQVVEGIEYTVTRSGDVKGTMRQLAFYHDYMRKDAEQKFYPLKVKMTISN